MTWVDSGLSNPRINTGNALPPFQGAAVTEDTSTPGQITATITQTSVPNCGDQDYVVGILVFDFTTPDGTGTDICIVSSTLTDTLGGSITVDQVNSSCFNKSTSACATP
jgi:hypothetical protein